MFVNLSPPPPPPAYSADPRRLARAVPEWVPVTWAGSGACGAALPEAAPREAFANGCLPETRARRNLRMWRRASAELPARPALRPVRPRGLSGVRWWKRQTGPPKMRDAEDRNRRAWDAGKPAFSFRFGDPASRALICISPKSAKRFSEKADAQRCCLSALPERSKDDERLSFPTLRRSDPEPRGKRNESPDSRFRGNDTRAEGSDSLVTLAPARSCAPARTPPARRRGSTATTAR
jgi:hypothetical protein